jgi:predicted TIM-barrel fold metal-dependent hydrolase
MCGLFAWHLRIVTGLRAVADAERSLALDQMEQSRAVAEQMRNQLLAESNATTSQSETRQAWHALHGRNASEPAQEPKVPQTASDLPLHPAKSAALNDGPDRVSLADRVRRMKQYLDSIRAIDTHDHLWPFDQLPGYVQTDKGRGMNLSSIWRNSYYTWFNPIEPWKPGGSFDEWWAKAKDDFDNARATSFYRYQLPAFQDLYGVDFEHITDDQAKQLNERIFENYRDSKWLYHVVTERANIELMFNDPYWARFDFTTTYPWEVLVFNVTTLVRGFHPSEFQKPADDPYHFARELGLKLESLDDYLVVLDRLFQTAKDRGAACLKTTLAYQRTLEFANVEHERAAVVFGRAKSELSDAQIKEFEDYIMWRLVELSAKYELPFQIHTGQARIQGSSPMLLVDLIEANPKTKFILFHGGFPWIGETGAIVMRHYRHVWIDSVWLPTLSYTMAKRAFHEWLEVMPSDRIMWGADCNHAEGIYGATELTRRCLAEVLTEKVDRGDLRDEHARRIARQIMRDNALQLFPQLEKRVRPE